MPNLPDRRRELCCDKAIRSIHITLKVSVQMPDLVHIGVARQGTTAIEEWRRQNTGVMLNLQRADLAGANLAESVLDGPDLSEANLNNSNLEYAGLQRAGGVLVISPQARISARSFCPKFRPIAHGATPTARRYI
jgi:hypothetical protein